MFTWSKAVRLALALWLGACASVSAQIDSIFINPNKNAAPLTLNMDAVYNRPFLNLGKLPVSLGGYVEAHSSYFATDGVTEGLSFVFPRLTVFMASSLRKRLKFLSEIEFEEGGHEINIEFASLDVEFHPLLNLRGGVVMNPIGAFNQNHDGPKWEFVERPLASTTIIPATWSNVGFGAFGKYATRQWVWAYEAYLTNGFNDRIIANTENRTWLPAAKADSKRFEESFNGQPLITLKSVVRHRRIAEVGLSWMGGIYNRFQDDGLTLDRRRRVDVLAIDVNTTLPRLRTVLTGEWTWAFIDVPATYSPQFGRRQSGGFIDVVHPVLRRPLLGWENSTLNLACRLEYVDYNISVFPETDGIVHDHVLAVVPAISFRPSTQTVFRVNYRYHWTRDLLGNPLARTAGFQFGFSTYF